MLIIIIIIIDSEGGHGPIHLKAVQEVESIVGNLDHILLVDVKKDSLDNYYYSLFCMVVHQCTYHNYSSCIIINNYNKFF